MRSTELAIRELVRQVVGIAEGVNETNPLAKDESWHLDSPALL